MRINESHLPCLLTSLCVPFIPKVGFFCKFFLFLIYSTQLRLPTLRLHCVSNDDGIEPKTVQL
jgi:hypothetical protein